MGINVLSLMSGWPIRDKAVTATWDWCQPDLLWTRQWPLPQSDVRMAHRGHGSDRYLFRKSRSRSEMTSVRWATSAHYAVCGAVAISAVLWLTSSGCGEGMNRGIPHEQPPGVFVLSLPISVIMRAYIFVFTLAVFRYSLVSRLFDNA